MSGRKSYSYLDPEGRIVWSDPNPSSSDSPPAKKRARLETDQEVLERLLAAGKNVDKYIKGRHLDEVLKSYSMPSRQYVDEEA
jgi:hypothetical protein